MHAYTPYKKHISAAKCTNILYIRIELAHREAIQEPIYDKIIKTCCVTHGSLIVVLRHGPQICYVSHKLLVYKAKPFGKFAFGTAKAIFNKEEKKKGALLITTKWYILSTSSECPAAAAYVTWPGIGMYVSIHVRR